MVKFIVPIEKKTRSHGANKMVTEIKVKYPGYVFAKLRLCPIVYETIQGLDLCRSWMGTVNHKGYKKLPPAPLALNEEEIENFGLEDVMEDVDDDESATADAHTIDANGIIVDSSDDDDDEKDMEDEEYSDPMYKNIDKKSLKQYKGFKVEDMVKVVQKGKFYNEDGIVRRLKDGQIFVRFYTYGTMFEEWLSPNDLRKLSSEEVLRGLSGSTQPITQKDFDERNGISDPQQQQYPRDRPMGVRDALQSSPNGMRGNNDRNRRQDRNVDRFNSNKNNYATRNDEQQRDTADKNWNWYKEQQSPTKKQNSVVGMDNEWTIRAGSNNDRNDDRWVEGDVDSQWGRTSQRQVRKEVRRTTPNSDNYAKNRLTEAAIDGTADWSAFVTSSDTSSKESSMEKSSGDSDDFFASLMSDLKKDLPIEPIQSRNDNQRSQQQQYQTPNNIRRQPQQSTSKMIESQNTAVTTNTNVANDFFSSLMSDLNKDMGGPMMAVNQKRSGQNPVPTKQTPSSSSTPSSEDDFFASLMSDLHTSPTTPTTSSSMGDSSVGVRSSQSNVRPNTVVTKNQNMDDPTNRQDDDFFASLEAELESSLRINTAESTVNDNNDVVPSSTIPQIIPTAQVNSRRPPPSRISSSDLEKNTIPVLKDMLRERGLKVSGTKPDLIDRLLSS